MHDRSRHFAFLPQTVSWYGLREHIATLDGAVITDLVTDAVIEAWIDFTYRGHKFTINNQSGDWWFFVNDPSCPDSTLSELRAHCRGLLGA